ncbi:MAG: hypothetical protein IJH80_05970 [Ruminococcus sp.]|nr:hypothetical protein [Ruminococcus sp.]MBQ7070237.1 hypothetical protein [Ruminococcus sp.]
MSKIRSADFYYGAVLSKLLARGADPIMIEGGQDRRIYEIRKKDVSFTLFVKFRTRRERSTEEGLNSWKFSIKEDMPLLREQMKKNKNLVLALLCASENLGESELALLDCNEVNRLLFLDKESISISRRSGEKYYRIANGPDREDSFEIKANRINDFFDA